MRLKSFLLPLLILTAAATLPAQTSWQVGKSLPIAGVGSWDYVTMDSATHRLFIPRSTHTLVIDATTGKTLGDVPEQLGAHGVALAPAANRGFITDGGGTGAIVVFDLTTYKILGKLAAMPDADGIVFDAKQNRVLAVSGDGEMLMSFAPEIDLATGKMETIALGGKPEFFAVDGSGKVFLNLEDKDMVAVVDLTQKKVVARWPVAPGGSPVGMSIDPKGHRLFIGTRKPQKMIVMSTETGKIEAALPICMGVDATVFDRGQAFASCYDGTLTVVSEVHGKFEVTQSLKTAQGARTMGMDTATRKIYLPTAEFLPVVPPATRPKAKPETFKILEVVPQ